LVIGEETKHNLINEKRVNDYFATEIAGFKSLFIGDVIMLSKKTIE
jgi:hypothetical protein